MEILLFYGMGREKDIAFLDQKILSSYINLENLFKFYYFFYLFLF